MFPVVIVLSILCVFSVIVLSILVFPVVSVLFPQAACSDLLKFTDDTFSVNRAFLFHYCCDFYCLNY